MNGNLERARPRIDSFFYQVFNNSRCSAEKDDEI
jgi:hypothetical protein